MVLLFTGQALLALAAAILAARAIRDLLYRASLDARPFLTALSSALETGDRDHARALADAAQPAFVAQIARAALANGPDADSLEETLADLRYQTTRALHTIRGLARLGTASGLLGIAIEVIWLFSGDHGLLSLEAGRVQSLAVQGSAIAISAGLGISVFCFVVLGVLRPAARGLLSDLDRAERVVRARIP